MTRAARSVALVLLAACSAEEPTAASGARGGGGGASGSSPADSGHGGGDAGFDRPLGGAGGGAGAAGSTVHAPGLDACASVEVRARIDVKPGVLLVIFDRSLTMNDPFDTPTGPQPKYLAAGGALINSIRNLACPSPPDPARPCSDPLTVGAIVFPTIPSCAVDPIEAPTQIDFRPSSEFIRAWDTFWMTNQLVFTTPFNAAFTRGDAALHRPDLVGDKAVVFFTDGESFCDDGLQAPALAAKWAGEGIKTYVVGLPGATGVKILMDTAAAGGTTSYITPMDSALLEQELRKIVVETAGFDSCTFTIDGRIVDAAQACDRGTVTLDGVDVPCDASDGFTIDDETHLTFQGSACASLMASTGRVEATFPCDVVVPD